MNKDRYSKIFYLAIILIILGIAAFLFFRGSLHLKSLRIEAGYLESEEAFIEILPLFITIFISSFIIIPGNSLVTASYASLATDIPNLLGVMIVVFIAAFLGDLAVYFIARKFSNRVNKYLRKFKWYKNKEEKARNRLEKYGFPFVFLSKFLIVGSSTIVNYISAFEKIKKSKFILGVLFGQIFYAVIYCTMGYFFRNTLSDAIKFLQSFMLGIVLVLIASYLIYRKIRRMRNADGRN